MLIFKLLTNLNSFEFDYTVRPFVTYHKSYMKECVNCGYVSDTPHCPNCGQKMEVNRVSLKGIINEFLSKWIGFDTQFGRTIVGMIIKPGDVVNSYLAGNRTKYIGPLGFLVIMTALVILSFDLFGIEVKDFIESSQSSVVEMFDDEAASDRQKEFQKQNLKKVNEFMAKNYRYMSVALIPFWSLSMWLFYRDRKLNYIERFTAVSYVTCQGLWLTMIMLGFFAITGIQLQWEFFGLSFVYYVYAFTSIFTYESKLVSTIKAVFSYIIGYLIFMVIAMLTGLILATVYVINNPEMLNQQN